MRALFRVTAWERVSPWQRLVGALARVGVLIVFLLLLGNLLGPSVGFFFTSRMVARKRPAITVAPTALTDYSVSNSAATSFSYFGYEFDVPLNTSFKRKMFERSSLAEFQFDSGQYVIFIVPKDENGLLSEIADDPNLKMGYLRPAFGDLMKRSAYEQYAALLSTTPQTIRAFGPRAEAARGVTLLTIKAIAFGPGLESGVYAFEMHDKRGFQIGDPQKSKRVDLEVFDSSGHHVELLCGSTKNNVRFSQPELNRIMASLHASSQMVALQK